MKKACSFALNVWNIEINTAYYKINISQIGYKMGRRQPDDEVIKRASVKQRSDRNMTVRSRPAVSTQMNGGDSGDYAKK